MQLTPDNNLIDAETMGELLALPPASIRRLSREGVLPHYQIGRLVRFNPAEVLETLRQEERDR